MSTLQRGTRRVGRGGRSAAWSLLLGMTLVPVAACSSSGPGTAVSLPAASSVGTSVSAASPGASGTAAAASPGASASASGGTVAGDGLGADLARRVTAAIVAKKTATITMTQVAQGTTSRGSGVVRYLDSGAEMSLRMVQGKETTRIILVKDAMYVAGPTKVNGKTWLKVSTEGDNVFSATMKSLQSSASYEQTTRTLAVVKVVDGGATTVSGVNVKKYSWTMDDTQIIAALSDDQPAAVKAALKGAKGSTTMYVDGNDLPVLVTSSVTVKGTTSKSTVAYKNWGGKVTIAVPAAKDVTLLPTT